jgi:uncharacterized protein (TIGR02284 family)
MSADEKVAKDRVETLKDGRNGFASAAEKLRDSDTPETATIFERLSQQRAGFVQDIVSMGHAYGAAVDESGSGAAAVHRGWISLKDALTGDDSSSVIGAAVTGEDHAVSEYEKALDEDDLSAEFRALLQQQHASIVAARDEVKALQHLS